MKNDRLAWTLFGMFGAGAVTMYFADPNRGRRRRAAVKDAFVHSGHEVEKFAVRFGRDFEHRAEGAVAETRRLFEDDDDVSDNILEQRVRTAVGRAVSHPHAVEVNCTGGSVFLGGWVLAEEVAELASAARAVRGVRDLSTFLNTTDHPERISDLQGGVRRRPLPEFLQKSWSPTSRVIAGCAGAALVAYGATHRKLIGKTLGVNGAILLARSVLNTPFKRLIGADQTAGLRIQKTVCIRASAADLYEFWTNPENYPKVFAHVKQITPEQNGIFLWKVSGPAGIDLSWRGRITRSVPGKSIEWRSLPESIIENHGAIHLELQKDGQTRVHINMSYSPPAGLLGHALASLLGLDPKSAMDQDIIQLKALFEQGKAKVDGHEFVKSELKSEGVTAA
jgi:uncharacterized membrane protein